MSIADRIKQIWRAKEIRNGIIFVLVVYMFISLLQGSVFLHIPQLFTVADPRVQMWKNFCILPLLFFLTFNTITDKIESYYSITSFGEWRNTLCFIADDADALGFVTQTRQLVHGRIVKYDHGLIFPQAVNNRLHDTDWLIEPVSIKFSSQP